MFISAILEDLATYILVGIGLVLAVASMLSLNAVLIALALVSLLAILIVHKMWYAIEAAIFKHTNLIQVLGSQQLGRDRSIAVRSIREEFVATAAVLLQGGTRSVVDREKIENIIAQLSYPFKFVLCAERLDAKRLLDKLQTKRNMKEMELSRISGAADNITANSARAALLKREIEQMEQDIKNISSGLPLKLARYVVTSAVAENRFAAEERAKAQMRELASEFSTLLDASAKMLVGDELLEALEIDSMVL